MSGATEPRANARRLDRQRRAPSHRALATSSGERAPSSASTSGSAARPQRTITRVVRARTRRTPVRRASRRGPPSERARSRATARALDASDGDGPGRDVGLDRRARDERDAVAGDDRAARRLLQPELEAHVEIAQAHPGAAQLVLDHLPHARRPPASGRAARPSARRASPSGRRSGARAARRARPRRGRTARTTTPAMAARGADDAELELAARRPARRRAACRRRRARRARRDGAAGTRRARPAARFRRARSTRRSRAARRARPPPRRRGPRAAVPPARAAAGRCGRAALPASVGSTRRPERSRSCRPSRFSSDRICRLTAGCVTPSCSAACEKLRRSTTAQNAAS